MEKNKVSVIMPAYNAEKYIKYSVTSILKQSYTNLQIIIVNDGSKDKTLEILVGMAGQDSRIEVFDKENGGPSEARNLALKKAQGEYLFFIDADDLIHKDAIRRLVEVAKETNADIVHAKYSTIYDYNNVEEALLELQEDVVEISKREAWEHLFDEYHMMYGTVWGSIYRKEIFENVEFPVGRVYEDTSITYFLYDKCKKIVCTNQVLYFYFDNQYSITHQHSIKNIMDSIIASEERMCWFVNSKSEEKGITILNIRFHLRHTMNCYRRISDYESKKKIVKSFKKAWRFSLFKKIGADIRKEALKFYLNVIYK